MRDVEKSIQKVRNRILDEKEETLATFETKINELIAVEDNFTATIQNEIQVRYFF